jgi:hypothetical protein
MHSKEMEKYWASEAYPGQEMEVTIQYVPEVGSLLM